MKDDPIDPKTAVPKRPLEGQQIKQRPRGLILAMENALRLACFVNYPLVNQRWQWKIPRGSDGNIHK